nr:ABATE domain-containing protein [uncultured Halomonas sp.]
MTNTGTQRDGSSAEAPMLGDHLAMDLLNTQPRNNGEVIEYWNSGDDVLKWLERCGAFSAVEGETVDLGELLAKGIALRTLARRLIVQRKEGEMGDIGGLNEYLHAYLSAPHLERDSEGNIVLTRTARGEASASLLGPVAEAVAQLLVEGNFTLVKQCDHPDCILWFYDRTKARKRRWCSMALCGNRYKAAQFRKRSSGETA